MLPKSWRRNGWSGLHLVAGLLLVIAAVLVAGKAWLNLGQSAMRDWQSRHALLVPASVAWLIWVRRRRLRRCRPVGRWIGAIIALAGVLMYSYGQSHALAMLWHAGALGLAVGAFLAVAGRAFLLQFLPALVALVFAVPLPAPVREAVTRPMEVAAAETTETLGEWCGIDVDRAEHQLLVNGQRFSTRKGNSCIGMVFSLAVVAYSIAFALPLRSSSRAILLLAFPICVIVCSVACFAPTVWISAYGPPGWRNQFHDVATWVMLALAFLLLFAVPRMLRWALVPVMRHSLAYD